MKRILPLNSLRTKRGAIVVSTGGHLEQALRRVNQLEIGEGVTFFVPRNSQSESRLDGFKHDYVANVRSRDIYGLIKVFFQLLLFLKKRDFDYVLSTGAGVAIACRILCYLKNIDFIYIESIARQASPSMTGKILAQMRTKNLYSESKFFDETKWMYIDSLFSEYHSFSRVPAERESDSLKIFVTVGTVHQYEFQRLVNLVNSVLVESDRVVWQIGPLNGLNLNGEVFKELSAAEFTENLSKADVVITHAGVGSVLNILDAGKYPILIPRRAEHGEHIDDHQLEIASVVLKLDLCTVITESLNRADLFKARLKGIQLSKKR
jgi:UDP-N-acetylglucosamine transferase subunit ALG13